MVNERALLAEEPGGQRGLAGVRAADEGDSQRLGSRPRLGGGDPRCVLGGSGGSVLGVLGVFGVLVLGVLGVLGALACLVLGVLGVLTCLVLTCLVLSALLGIGVIGALACLGALVLGALACLGVLIVLGDWRRGRARRLDDRLEQRIDAAAVGSRDRVRPPEAELRKSCTRSSRVG